VTSPVPTTSADGNAVIFGQLNLRAQTAGMAATAFTYINGPANARNPDDANKRIVSQAAPGIGTLNPDTGSEDLKTAGEDGGWYSVVMSSPWNTDIRQDGNTF